MNVRRVVVLDHTGQLGGAEIALQRLLLAIDDSWDVSVLLFSDGPFRRALEESGVRVDVLTMPDRMAAQSRGGLGDPRVLRAASADSIAFAKSLAQRISAMGADLVVANSLKAAVVAELSSWRTRLPWVWHLHDRLSADYLPPHAVATMRLLARRASHVVANSGAVAALTALPPRRLTVAYPGLPKASFSDRRVERARPVFGLLGRISSTKGQQEFIEAAALVERKIPDARFRVVGDALFSDLSYASHVRRLPTQLGLGDKIEFTGWAEDPAAALDGFGVLVHASPVPEPFGQVIVEGMARCVPVIATQGGGVGEILMAPPASLPAGAFLTTPVGRMVMPRDVEALASAMVAAIVHSARSSDLAHAAQTRAAQAFSIETTAQAATRVWLKQIRSDGLG